MSWPLTVMPSWLWWRPRSPRRARRWTAAGRTTMPAQKPRVSSPRRPSIAFAVRPTRAGCRPRRRPPRAADRVARDQAALADLLVRDRTPVRPRSSCIRLARIVVRVPAFSTPANVLSVSVLRVSLVSLLRSPMRMPRSKLSWTSFPAHARAADFGVVAADEDPAAGPLIRECSRHLVAVDGRPRDRTALEHDAGAPGVHDAVAGDRGPARVAADGDAELARDRPDRCRG